MLENIKLLLGLNDDSKDQIILYYIDKVSDEILNYCNLEDLPSKLEWIVESKIYGILKSQFSPQSTGEVKAVTRGDTRIEYNVATAESSDITLSNSEKMQCNAFRRLRR